MSPRCCQEEGPARMKSSCWMCIGLEIYSLFLISLLDHNEYKSKQKHIDSKAPLLASEVIMKKNKKKKQ